MMSNQMNKILSLYWTYDVFPMIYETKWTKKKLRINLGQWYMKPIEQRKNLE